MTKKLAIISCFALTLVLGCQEEMVGAPCTPETDDGVFSVGISGTTWSIETRSVQCETRVCLTKVSENQDSSKKEDCKNDPNRENCWGTKPVEGDDESGFDPAQLKFSFCSCRCRDSDGHGYSANSDKYDDLCECPPSTKCQEVLKGIEDAPEKVSGSYCIPKCIAEPCDTTGEICTPSKNSEEPWKWYCSEITE